MKKSPIPKISAVIIAKNAAKHFSECLRNLLWLDEIILVIDAASTDETIDIAKKFKTKTYRQKWLGYAKQKNFAISKARNNWILSIDTDEIVDEQLKKTIGKTDLEDYNGFYIARKNYFGKRWVRFCGWYPDWQLRLFKKNIMKFAEKAVHEQVKPVGKVGYIQGHIIHYTYSNNQEYFTKINDYTALDARILYEKKRKWTIFYQIGKPIKEFCEMYFAKLGFLDGLLGMKICAYSAFYRWSVIKKLREMYHENRH